MNSKFYFLLYCTQSNLFWLFSYIRICKFSFCFYIIVICICNCAIRLMSSAPNETTKLHNNELTISNDSFVNNKILRTLCLHDFSRNKCIFSSSITASLNKRLYKSHLNTWGHYL